MAEFNVKQYLQRRVKQLRAEGKSHFEIVQQLSVMAGRKEVIKFLEAEQQRVSQ